MGHGQHTLLVLYFRTVRSAQCWIWHAHVSFPQVIWYLLATFVQQLTAQIDDGFDLIHMRSPDDTMIALISKIQTAYEDCQQS